MRKLPHKKLFAIAALAALVLVFLPISGPTIGTWQASFSASTSRQGSLVISSFSPNIAFAQAKAPDFLSCISSPFSCAVTGISWLINKIISLFIILGATFASAILKLNGKLFDSPIVQVGFSITLAFANLGFVLAIIIIAIATILRNQTYGVKQLLWKLVIMAILVNFGLVITRPIVALSDSMSGYFIQQMSGSTGDFVNNLTAAFSPQTLPAVEGTPASGASALATPNCKNFSSGWAMFGCTLGSLALGPGFVYLTTPASSPDTFMQSILALVFSATFLAIVAFSLIALAILLLLRYLYITFLLILLPLAWLAWVFPGMKSHFDKWWHLFIRWTFFPAISFFFIYLAMLIAPGATTNGTVNQNASYISGSLGTTQILGNGLAGGATLGSSEAQSVGLAQQALTELVLCGLVLGGLYAANSLGIAGAGVAMGYAKSAGGWVAGYAGKQGKKTARLGYQKIGGEKITKSLQEGRIGAAVKKIPLIGGVAGGIIRRGESLAGRGISSISSNEKLVEGAKKNVPKNPEEVKQRLRGSMNKEDQFAHIAKLIEMDELKGDEMVNGMKIKDFLDSNGDAIKRFGQTKPLVVDADKVMGGNKDTRDAERELTALPQAARATSEAMRKLEAATKKFVEGLSKADIAKMNVNGVFERKFDARGNLVPPTEAAKALAGGFFKFAPQLVSSLMPKMKSGALRQFPELYRKAGADEKDKILNNRQLTPDQRNNRIAKIDGQLVNFEQMLANNVLYGGTVQAATPTAPPTPPPSP